MKWTYLAAAALSLAPMFAHGATFNVVDNPGGQSLATENGIANFGLFSQTLSGGDSVSVTFDGANLQTSVGIGFSVSPVNVGQMFELVYTGSDFSEFGDTELYLSSSTSVADAVASATITGPGQLVELNGVVGASPFFVLYEFETASFGSFTGDLVVSVAPVPVPASGALLIAAIGAGALIARKKRRD